MKTLIYYEKRKILRRKSTIIACLLMLLSIIALSFVFVSDQGYYRTDGTEVSGMEAIHVKQEMDHALAGPLTAKRLKDALQQYHTVYGNSDNFGTSGALKDEVYCKDILPYNGILNLMRRIYSPAGAYDMNILSSIRKKKTALSRLLIMSTATYIYCPFSMAPRARYHLLKNPAKGGRPIIENAHMLMVKEVTGICLYICPSSSV